MVAFGFTKPVYLFPNNLSCNINRLLQVKGTSLVGGTLLLKTPNTIGWTPVTTVGDAAWKPSPWKRP